MSAQTRKSTLLSNAALLGLLTPATIALSCGQAMAQTAPDAASASESEGPLNEIIVTARGREESLIEVPVAISALSQDELDSAGVTDIEGVSDYTPGFRFQNSDGQAGGRSSAALQFRGVSSQVSSAANRTGAIFYDGAYISQGAGFIPMIDLERVEVIKGPQNAVFARNTFSGAVNFVPKEPGDELEISGELEVNMGTSRAEEAGYRGVFAIGSPITDSIGLRVATTYERVGADYEYLDGTPNGREDNFAILGTATFDVTNALRLKATGFFVDSKDTSNAQSVNGTVA
ncbi:MAG: TonB-dependent receptor plug domain-containing protein, partial [Hyphomicrobiales bacterium]